MVGPMGAFVILLAALLVGSYFQQRNLNQQTRASQLAGCERGKQDRMDHARVYEAQAHYWQGVLGAKSVHEDVKRVARVVHAAVERSARGMRSRILKCGPLIDDGKSIPDRALLRQLPSPLQ